jgi:hypothetical protein
MKNKLRYSAIALFIFIMPLQAQEQLVEQSDEMLIKETIQKYFDGWLTGDTALIGQAMHRTCHLKFNRDEKVVAINRNDYLSGFKPHERTPNAEGRLISLDITRTAASAKCEIERPNRLFTDYFNLLKIDGRWYIVDKISTSVSKE